MIRIASLNLHHTHDRWDKRRIAVIEDLIRLKPDVLALQEVAWMRGQADWVRKQLNQAFPEEKQLYRLVQKRRPLFSGGSEAVAILSRLPILSVDWLNLGFDGRIALRANIELAPMVTADVVSTHLHSLPGGTEIRRSQLLRLFSWLHRGGASEERQIIAGTLTASDHLHTIALAHQHQFESAHYLRHHTQRVATYPTMVDPDEEKNDKTRDYILLSSADWQIEQTNLFCQTPISPETGLYPSDHVGIFADLQIFGT